MRCAFSDRCTGVSPRRCSSHAAKPDRARPLALLSAALALGWLAAALSVAQAAGDSRPQSPVTPAQPACLDSGDGYLKAGLKGDINSTIDWPNAGTACEGMPRPSGRGLRLSFAREVGPDGHRLVLVFGIARVGENQSGQALPVNVTVIVEGASLIYGTRGDDKCMIDRLRSVPLKRDARARVYRIEARGFCTQPARAVLGSGSVLVSTFDFAGQVSFDESTPPPPERDDVSS
jgi:hypothetical protein